MPGGYIPIHADIVSCCPHEHCLIWHRPHILGEISLHILNDLSAPVCLVLVEVMWSRTLGRRSGLPSDPASVSSDFPNMIRSRQGCHLRPTSTANVVNGKEADSDLPEKNPGPIKAQSISLTKLKCLLKQARRLKVCSTCSPSSTASSSISLFTPQSYKHAHACLAPCTGWGHPGLRSWLGSY